jgi:hypothetical protein
VIPCSGEEALSDVAIHSAKEGIKGGKRGASSSINGP